MSVLPLQRFDLISDFLIGNDLICAIEILSNLVDFLPERQCIIIEGSKLRLAGLTQINYRPGKTFRTRATIGPMGAIDGFNIKRLTVTAYL